jgi:L-lactate dehydrogenase complex protein LldG
MNDRDRILEALRAAPRDELPLPDVDFALWRAGDPAAAFVDELASVGGTAVRVHSVAEAQAHLEGLPSYRSAARVCSTVSGLGRSDVDLARVEGPHELSSVDVAIVKADLAVAENGAVWLRGDAVRHRVLYFLVPHLVVVVEESQLVQNMHEAYERIAARGFGVFVSGPSKTADIEQALVLGAHGPMSMTVYLVSGSSHADDVESR